MTVHNHVLASSATFFMSHRGLTLPVGGVDMTKTENKMDEYDKKFVKLQKYIPLLEVIIVRLLNIHAKDKYNSSEVQLKKVLHLHGILSNSKQKLKIETLQKYEDILQKLHNKVETAVL
ncbi:PREDICTED: uncharacterized protein LOC108779769 [Cyphomyrmex costatus]|uniref:uncharacterized protein LOC108779769 n=1 Tax=Cyphomyrmex costatus TaxID=456900 RepID=UPI0008521EE4|nr:PREDICTED: uncharacterized protein LOC108779769 [Cyphomyrmex costatus]